MVVITKDRRGTRYRDMSRPGKCNGRISEHRTIKIQPFLWSLKTVKESFKGQAEKYHLRRKYSDTSANE